MEFKKYNSIENSYRTGFIQRFCNAHPELLHEKFIITEKIHGANFSIMIDKDNITYGKRTSKLEINEGFFGYLDVVKKYEEHFKTLQKFLINTGNESLRLFGELFGGNIQKGISYGIEKRIKLFDGELNGEILTQIELINILTITETMDMFVPLIGIVDSLKEALDVDIRFNSKLSELKEDNICEGVVIKPYNKIYKYQDGAIFYLKKKNVEFSEKQRAKKIVINFEPSENFENVVELYKSHLTENRLDGIFSKYGKISEPSQIGDYLRHMTNDAKIDFFKDYSAEFMALNEEERKKIFNHGTKTIVEMLKHEM